MAKNHSTQFDAAIIGGGIAGLALAIGLTQQDKHCVLIEPQPPKRAFERDELSARVVAINAASQQLLTELGVWQNIPPECYGIFEAMHVWDASGEGEIHFHAADINAPVLGHIVPNDALRWSLWQAAQHAGVDFIVDKVHTLQNTDSGHTITLTESTNLTATMLFGADGQHSAVREQVGIPHDRTDYGQHAITAVIQHEQTHQHTAWQCFHAGGPVAFLPLDNRHHSVMVWSMPSDAALRHLKQDDATFCYALTQAVQDRFGRLSLQGKRYSFPLTGLLAERMIDQNMALVGDAAHVVHPLAGLGINIGLKDVAVLLKCLAEKDWGDTRALRAYERRRKAEIRITKQGIEGFINLFGNDSPLLTPIRNQGLKLVNRQNWLKKQFMHYAMQS